MGIVFELKANKAILDKKEFCRLKDGLTYVGRFADNKTSEVIQGTIIQYNDKYYSTEIPFRSGISIGSADKDGMVTTYVELFEIDYIPEECKPLSDCPIRIYIWDLTFDDEGPICSYAFYNNQLKEAKEVVNVNNDVDIFIDGVQIAREDFLKR